MSQEASLLAEIAEVSHDEAKMRERRCHCQHILGEYHPRTFLVAS